MQVQVSVTIMPEIDILYCIICIICDYVIHFMLWCASSYTKQIPTFDRQNLDTSNFPSQCINLIPSTTAHKHCAYVSLHSALDNPYKMYSYRWRTHQNSHKTHSARIKVISYYNNIGNCFGQLQTPIERICVKKPSIN